MGRKGNFSTDLHRLMMGPKNCQTVHRIHAQGKSGVRPKPRRPFPQIRVVGEHLWLKFSGSYGRSAVLAPIAPQPRFGSMVVGKRRLGIVLPEKARMEVSSRKALARLGWTNWSKLTAAFAEQETSRETDTLLRRFGTRSKHRRC